MSAENHMTVRCDADGCGWQKEEHVAEMEKWHNAACPACGHTPILSDHDIETIGLIVGLRDLGALKIGQESKTEKPSVLVVIDTAGMRCD